MNHILFSLLQILWLFLPAIFANSMPVVAARFNWFPSLARPIDGSKKWRNRELFGDHKTIRGFVVGIVSAAIIGALQHRLWSLPFIQSISLVSYPTFIFSVCFAGLLGAAALFADAIKSFVKRQCDIRSGKSWPPFDQIDFVIGVLIAASFFIHLTSLQISLAIIFFGVGSFVVSVVGVMLGIKKSL